MTGTYPVPAPPYAEGIGLPWDVRVDDAVAMIAAGVESFYALAEETASKAVADYLMLRRILPDDIFVGRRTLSSTLFRPNRSRWRP